MEEISHQREKLSLKVKGLITNLNAPNFKKPQRKLQICINQNHRKEKETSSNKI